MSIWSRLVGEAARIAEAGPLASLINAIGGGTTQRSSRAADAGDGTRQIAFTIGVIALGAKMAKADGTVTPDEVEAFKQVFRIPPDEARNVGRVFDLARRDAAGFEPYARQIARLFEEGSPVLEDLLHCLFHIAMADGVIHPAELAYLEAVARIFGFDEVAFERIKAMHMPDESRDPYMLLGVAHDVTDLALKRHYRRLVREHHPDRRIAEGLPPEFIELANQRLAAINEAYERIARSRGLA